MGPFALISAVGLPLLMFAGGIAAWRRSTAKDRDTEAAAWRDDSLDEWRRNREEEQEQERVARAEAPASTTVRAEGEETTRHQRIGG